MLRTIDWFTSATCVLVNCESTFTAVCGRNDKKHWFDNHPDDVRHNEPGVA